MSSLPNPSLTIACGACGSELDHDGDTFACYDCQLQYSNDLDSPAEYLDPDEKPCGKPHHQGTYVVTRPFKTSTDAAGDKTVELYRTAIQTFAPCVLPASHTGLCEWPDHTVFEYHVNEDRTLTKLEN